MMDVYFYEAFREEAQRLKAYLPSHITAGYTWKTIQETGDSQPPAPLISIRTQSQIPPEWRRSLKGILTRSTGYDHIKKYLVETGSEVAAGYLPLYCNRAVAEQAMLLWMSLMRKLPLQMKQFQTFNRDGLSGTETSGKRLAVVGVGNIGSEVVKIGVGLGMKVRGVDLVEKYDYVDYCTIDEALVDTDVIVCAMNLTDENFGYFNYPRLKKAPAGVLFVNVARGEMSSAADLKRLLDEKHLGGLALDVLNREGDLGVALRQGRDAASANPEVQALLELSHYHNVIFTPHNAFNTVEAVERKARQSMEQIEQFLKTGTFIWPMP